KLHRRKNRHRHRPRPRRQRHPRKINRSHHRRTRRRNERRRDLHFARADRGPPVPPGGHHRHSAGGHFSASLSPHRLAWAPAFFQRLRSALAGHHFLCRRPPQSGQRNHHRRAHRPHP